MTMAEHAPKSGKSARPNFLSFENELGGNTVEGAVGLPLKEAAHSVPIVIDCGSWNFRAGYANEPAPSLIFEPVVHRLQMKGGAAGSVQYGIGNAALPANVSKSSSRSPFESALSPVIVHPTSMEHILDHIFTSLKVGGKAVDHDIVMTECVANPIYCRNEMAELLFECYGVPRVLFGIDAMFSLHANLDGDDCGTRLVLSVGNCGTFVMPVVEGKLVWSSVRRINWGGAVGADYLLRLLQLKYPGFPQRMTWSQAQEAFINAAQFALDYDAKMEALASDKGALDAADFVLQFPFVPTDLEALAIKAKEREALARKRQELADRLREKAKQKKLEKLQVKKEHLEALLELQAKAVTHADSKPVKKKAGSGEEEENSSDIEQEVIEEDETFEDLLLIHGFDSAEDLGKAIEVAKADLRGYENRLAGIEEARTAPDYSLLDVPDDQLDEDRLQEKRRQRLMKAGAEARERLRLEREEAARKEAEAQERLEALRASDFEGWRAELYGQRNRIIKAIKERQAKREALSNRRSQASGARLRTVVSLATAEDDTVEGLRRADGQDDFGAKDSDWQVYREIRGGGDEDAAEAEEEALEALSSQLLRVEGALEEHDEAFYAVLAQEMAASRTILDRLAEPRPSNDEAARHQLHLNVERWRATEGLFQPRGLLGLDQGGLAEAVGQVVSQFPPAVQTALLGNVFVTGGATRIAGLHERLQAELLPLTPFGAKLGIAYAQDPQLDAWRGAARIGTSHDACIPWVTKDWYRENGGSRLPYLSGPAYYTNPY